MEINNFYIENKVFTESECDSILKYMTKLQQTIYSARIDGKFIEEGCLLKSQDLLYSKHTKWIFDKVKSFISENVKCEWIEGGQPHGVFRNYSENDFFLKHTDNVDSVIADKRFLTVSIQLSDSNDYIGGDFIINEEIKLSRTKGNTILFGTYVPHEITKIKKGIRNSLTFFVSEKHIKINENFLKNNELN